MEKGKIDIALLIVLFTGVVYGTAYIFEYNYHDYYRLPVEFIDLNITTITGTLLPILLVAGALFSLGNYIVYFFFNKIENPPLMLQFIILIGVSSILLFAGFIMGGNRASTKEEYMILKHEEELFVVVTSYSDNLIIAPLDINTETISPEFQAIEIKSMKETQIITFEGGLKVKEIKSSKEFKEKMN
ncbi:hypothetical protein [Lysinibacillus fusiformis]|uniref:hypothetical protein n=1 Tax=Lysinibacillus fusiformis TaxID=28031 RepID=UPI0020C08098|nr:hypothetical protein [Lysinibacillus fusiformis]